MALITAEGGVKVNPDNPIGAEPSSSAAAQACLDDDGILEIPSGIWKFTTPLVFPAEYEVVGKGARIWSYANEFASWSADADKFGITLSELWCYSGTQTVFNVNHKLSNQRFNISRFQCRSTTAPLFRVENDLSDNTKNGHMYMCRFEGDFWEQHEAATVPAFLVDVDGNHFTEITYDIGQMRGSANSVFALIRNKKSSQFCYGIRIRGCALEKMAGGAFHFYGCSGVYIDNPHGYDLTAMNDHTILFGQHPGGNPCVIGEVGYRRMIARDASWTKSDIHLTPGEAKAFNIVGGGGHSHAQDPTIALVWEDGHRKQFADRYNDSIKEVTS